MRTAHAVVLASSLVVVASSTAFAQVPIAPAAEQKPPAAAQPPIALFPEEARFAFIDFQRVASTSEPGKIATRILKEFSDKKVAELEVQNRQLQALAAKRDTGMASGDVAAQMAREVARLQREVEFARESAQVEFQQLRTDVEMDLQSKVAPVVAEIAKEKRLHAVFTIDSTLLYRMPALDISDEVVRRLDLQVKKGK
jgi:Skp family chaperone for outer membrane proteins